MCNKHPFNLRFLVISLVNCLIENINHCEDDNLLLYYFEHFGALVKFVIRRSRKIIRETIMIYFWGNKGAYLSSNSDPCINLHYPLPSELSSWDHFIPYLIMTSLDLSF